MEAQQEFDIPVLKEKLLEFLGPDAGVYPVAIEQKFPRILDKIVSLWGKAGLDAFLAELMVSDRPGRQGFPADVAMELFRLSTLHGSLGLTPQKSVGTGWGGIEDAELFKREFLKAGK